MLDIQLINGTGFELLEKIGKNRSFDVIFITAQDDFAIKAIKKSAVDYILKPINSEELAEAVNMYESREKKRKEKKSPNVDDLLGNIKNMLQIRRIAIPSVGHIRSIE